MFVLQSVRKRFGGQVVLDGTTWQAPSRGLVGLVGPNGAGKTTLLRIIAGDEELDGGEVTRPAGSTLGYLPQELAESDAAGSVLDTILRGREDLLELEARIETLQAAMEAGEPDAVAEHAAAMEAFEQRGGWQFRAQARQLAAGLGFPDEDLERPITTFSGGWQMRALLARLLLRRPDVLLLDEPTNHLDTETLEWLEEFLGRYEGLIVVVSHDRYFLNRMATSIVELHHGQATEYVGNWDEYREKRAARIERLQQAKTRQDKEIARIREFIEKFRYKATKARQVQSRVKQLEKIDRIEVPDAEKRQIQFRFPQPPRTPKIVAALRGVGKRYDDNVVWRELDLEIRRGDKIALMGPNGAGKTTMLKLLADVIAPDGGEILIGNGVDVAYFAQHAVDQLDPNTTVLDEMMDAADMDTAPQVRTILGTFGFSGESVDKQVKVLSGGEKNRLALAKMMLAPAGLLLLDEPTNHLDIDSRQVLEYALNDYDGAYIVVSHDRYFVNEVAKKVIHLEEGEATRYLGDYDYYRWKRAEERERLDDEAPAEPEDDDEGRKSKKELRREAAELRKRIREETRELRDEVDTLESRIMELEETIDQSEAKLAEPDIYSDEEESRKWGTRYQNAKDELDAAMARWEEASLELESAEEEIAGRG